MTPYPERKWHIGHAWPIIIVTLALAVGVLRCSSQSEEIRSLIQDAEQGDADAQFKLAGRYRTGRGVREDLTEATRWYLKAAEQGHALAQLSAGIHYAGGFGVPRDNVLAYKWMSLSVSRFGWDEIDKRETAIYTLDDLSRRMSPAQIAEAQRRASEWEPKHP